MKKLFLISILFVLTLTATSQVSLSLNEGESNIVYALPATELCIVVETEKTSQSPGMFYRYCGCFRSYVFHFSRNIYPAKNAIRIYRQMT